MAHTLTDLIPDLYAALGQVSRELVGFIPAVTMDAQVARAAVGQQVISPIAPAASATNITSGVTPPADGDQDVGNVKITISKARRVPVTWNGEQSLAVNNGGTGVLTIRAQQFAQAMRTLSNEIEADLGLLYKRSSRAYGTAGTTPFATAGDFTDGAEVRKILADNGAPLTDLQLVINTTAGAKFRGKQSQAYMAGNNTMLTQGVLIDMHGMMVRESAQVVTHTKGTGTSYQTNNAAGYAVGASDLALDTGSGTVLAGDVVTFTGDTNKYVIGTTLAAGATAINLPGLRSTLADNVAMAVGNNYAANMAFSKSAMVLATRAPALPEGGDMAEDRLLVTDPHSGLSFEVSVYLQYRQVQYEVAIAWGAACVKPEHTAILLG
jgi:hypothetical protein